MKESDVVIQIELSRDGESEMDWVKLNTEFDFKFIKDQVSYISAWK